MATYTGADRALAFLFDIAASIAADYDASETYVQNAYAIYDGTLYKCTTAISTPETFNPAHWEAVLVMDEVAAGGGGGGTTVIANPQGAATDILNRLQVESTIYSLPSGGGGSSSINYSETEQMIGTWIDGKTVYEKTINFGAMPNNTSKSVNHNIADLDYIIDIRGTTMTPEGGCFPVPFVNDQGYTSQLCLFANRTSITVRTQANRSAYTICYITIRYTKTIDTTVYDRALENETDIRITETSDTRQTENITGA